MKAYDKDLLISDLRTSLFNIDQFHAGVRGIKATADRAGDKKWLIGLNHGWMMLKKLLMI